MRDTLKKGGVLWVALIAALIVGLVACSSAEPTETGPSAAEIQNIVQSAVAGIDTGPQLTAADVQRIVEQSAGDVLTASDVQNIVQQSVGTQLTAADVQKIINNSAAGQLTAADVQRIVDASAGQQLSASDVQKIVQDSTGQQLTASDVQKIVDASAAGQLTTADVQRIISASVSEAVDAANAATEAAMMAQKAAEEAGMAAMDAGEKAQLALARLPELTAVGAQEGFSRVTLPTLEPPPADTFKAGFTLNDSQELQYLYQGGPKEEVTPPFREGGGDRAHYWWIFMPPFHFASIANDMELRQGFATGYSVSDDGIEYLLHINPDAIFQDGSKITAAALKDAWEFAAYPDNQVGWGAILLHTRAIKGMKALEQGDAMEAEGLKVVDDLTLSITMEQFTPTWPLQMAVWMLGIYNSDQARNDPEGFRINPIGAGPYQASYDDATDIQHYDRAANYWGDSPFMDRVVRPTVRDLQTGYLLYENGEIDVLYADSVRQPAIWQPDNPFHNDLVLQGGKGLWYTAFVTDHPPFDDLNVRKAFSLAADMWSIVPAILGPKAQYGGGILTEGNACSQWPDVGYPYDPEAARAALAASKYGSAENVPVPTLEISRPSIISIFEVVQEQWKDNLGIEINLVRLEPGQQRRDVVEFKRRSLGGRIPDPSGVLSDLGLSTASTVQGGAMFANPQLDALIVAAQKMTLDDPNYCNAWQEIEKTIMDNYYYFPLMAGDDRTWVVQPWVQGYVGSLGQYFNTLPWWQIGVRDRGLY